MFTTKTGDDCIEFIVAGKPEYIDAVCLAIKIFAEDKGFNEEKLEDIELASKEACKIVICHKRDGYASKYKVKCEGLEDGIKIAVEDVSCEKRIRIPEQRICLNCPEEGNVCLELIKSLMDEAQIEQKKEETCSITMVKKHAR